MLIDLTAPIVMTRELAVNLIVGAKYRIIFGPDTLRVRTLSASTFDHARAQIIMERRQDPYERDREDQAVGEE